MIASGGNPDGPNPASCPVTATTTVHWVRMRDRGAAVMTTCSMVDLCSACDLLCITSTILSRYRGSPRARAAARGHDSPRPIDEL